MNNLAQKNPKHHFICVGAARSGTTQFWEWLNGHPDVHMSKIKETNFFTHDLIGRNGPGDIQTLEQINNPNEIGVQKHAALVRDWQTYQQLLYSQTKTHYGEASPSYLFYAKVAAARIYAFNPECRILILLREPASRALSNHGLFTHLNREHLSFRDALNAEADRMHSGWEHGWAYRTLGYYHAAVGTYLALFGQERVWIGLYEELAEDPQAMFDCACDFLGISRASINVNNRANQSQKAIGPLLRLSRTKFGLLVSDVLPSHAKKAIRESEQKIQRLIKTAVINRDILKLRAAYKEDVQKLNALVPQLNITKKWNYEAR